MTLAFILTGCIPNPNASDNIEISNSESHEESMTTVSTTYTSEDEKQVSTSTSSVEIIEPVTEEPKDGKLVRILDYIPDAVIDLKYATSDNFTQTILYDDPEAYLCYGTVKKLMNVQKELKVYGLSILIWDAYRSPEAQQKLWNAYPDPNFVADPRNGLTSHSKGNTVDISIIRLDGESIELPSAFDEFTYAADRDYSDVSEKAAQNAMLLEEVMYNNGFKGYRGEWWDYTDTNEYVLEQTTVLDNDQSLIRFLNEGSYSLSDIADSEQLVTVKTDNSNCNVCCYEKQNEYWNLVNTFNGVIGKNGATADKREGDGCTPKGKYNLGFAFGIDNVNSNLEYRILNNNCYWVDDVNSEFYNQWVESENIQWNSAEHLIDYRDAYYYAIVVRYNTDPIIKNKGSAIFLHCISGGYTAGCIAVPRNNMEYLLGWLIQKYNPIIIIKKLP